MSSHMEDINDSTEYRIMRSAYVSDVFSCQDLLACLPQTDAVISQPVRNDELVLYVGAPIKNVTPSATIDFVAESSEDINFADLPKLKKAKGKGNAALRKGLKNLQAKVKYHTKMLRRNELLLFGIRQAKNKAATAGELNELTLQEKKLKKKIAQSRHVLK